jgi:polysaccharide deacetylase 2 family uncharacterized protein YibQ
MRRPARKPIRAASSAAPALAGGLVSALFLAGAIAFSAASAGPAAAPGNPVFGLAVAAPATEPEAQPLEAPVLLAEAAPVQPPRPPLAASAAAEPVPTGPVIALVIDDVGLDVAATRRAIALPAPTSLAFLPYADATPALAREAGAAGLDVLVHMPMEPRGLADPGPNALMRHLSEDQLTARMRWAWSRVPGAVGINNHMGSRFTEDPGAMRRALSAIAGEAPLFLDSLTTARSRGAAAARGLGLTAMTRDVFIDHVDEGAAIAAALAEVEAVAREQGRAIAIGHPRALTLEALETWIPEARARGIAFGRLSQLSPRKTSDAPRLAMAAAHR